MAINKSVFRLSPLSTSATQLTYDSHEIKKIGLAFTTFRQLEIQSDGQPILESFFLDALRGMGFEDSESRLLLNILHDQGQIYETKPRLYRSV